MLLNADGHLSCRRYLTEQLTVNIKSILHLLRPFKPYLMYINTHVTVTATWHWQHLHGVQRSPVLRRKSAGETECSLLLLLPPVLPAIPCLFTLKSSHSQQNSLQNDLFPKCSALLMDDFSLQLSAHGNLLPCAVGVPGQELMLRV